MVHSIFIPVRRELLPCAAPAALLVALSVAALTAQAQPAGKTGRPDPLDPQASVPTLVYRSPFKADPRASDKSPISWREANDAVARIGGWRAYAREAQQPEPAAAKPAPPMPSVSMPEPTRPMPLPPTAPAGHSGHKMP
jgi:hypothetical protein